MIYVTFNTVLVFSFVKTKENDSFLASQYDTMKGECDLNSTANEMKGKHN